MAEYNAGKKITDFPNGEEVDGQSNQDFFVHPLVCQCTFDRQQILLSRMALAIGLQQADKALIDRQIQILNKESFTLFQCQSINYSSDEQFLTAYDLEQATNTGTSQNKLVRHLASLKRKAGRKLMFRSISPERWKKNTRPRSTHFMKPFFQIIKIALNYWVEASSYCVTGSRRKFRSRDN